MTSEVENILKGQVEAKTSDLKQIAVSTSNLTPDASGIAPLEKQTAFTPVQQEPTQTQEPVPTPIPTPEVPSEQVVPEVQPAMTPEQPVPAQEPVPEPVAPVLPEANNNLENPINNMQTVESAPVNAAAEQPVANENDNLESIDYNKPAADGVLTAPPVDVAPQSGMDQMNISAFVDKSIEGLNELVKEEAPAPEPTVQKMEMPVVDQEIKAQEPTGQDNRLFEGADVDLTQPNESIPAVGDTPFEVPAMDNNAPAVAPLEAPVNAMETPEVTNVVETAPTEEMSSAPLEPVQEENAMETPALDAIPSFNVDNTVSAFDDHLTMPDNVAQQFNIPTLESVTSNETPAVENAAPVQDAIPSMDSVIPTIESSLPQMESEMPAVDNSMPSFENNNVSQTMLSQDTIDVESVIDPIVQRFKDELIFAVKSMNSAAKMDNKPEMPTEPVIESVPTNDANPEMEAPMDMNVHVEMNQPVEEPNPNINENNLMETDPMMMNNSMEMPQPVAAAGFNDIEHKLPEPDISGMMNVDDEPVHGKFI